jgi:nicotinamidase-related amidase
MANAVLDPTDPTSPLSVSPNETALLLMDYLNMFRGKIGEGAWTSVTNIAAQLRDWALFKNMMVVHCLINTSPGVKPPGYTRISTRWRAYEAAFAATPELGHEAEILVHKEFSLGESTVFRTPGLVSALESYGLIEALRARGIRSLILGGISTSGCVLSTARAASDRGLIVTVAEDACFDPIPGLHGMLASHVLPMSAHVATSGELRDAWKVL